MQGRTTIHDLVAQARTTLRRVTAWEAHEAVRDGALLIDTRSREQQEEQGLLPGARHHPLSVLEWRLCPSAPCADPDVSFDDRIIVVCAHGFSSSLAAARLQALGFRRATDLIDGVEGWRAAGLPLHGAPRLLRGAASS